MDVQPAAGPAVPNERKNSKVVRRARTAAATAARKRAATGGAPEDDGGEDASTTPSSGDSNASGLRFMRRSTSPAASMASNMSDLSDLRPSSTGNRLLVTSNDIQCAEGFRPVHIPSLTSALSHHLLCPICKKKDTLVVGIHEERSLGAAGVLNFKCTHCKETTVQVPTSPSIASGKKKGELQELNLRVCLASVVAGMSENGAARFLGILGMPYSAH